MHINEIFELLSTAKARNVVVAGSGLTGQAVCRFLSSLGAFVTIVDDAALAPDKVSTLKSLGAAEVIECFSANDGAVALLSKKNCHFAVMSPGISRESQLASKLSALNLPMVSEIDLAVSVLGMPKVAVTGTNGKTTTVNLIYQMLKQSDLDAALVGNVGKPYVSLIDGFGLTKGADLKIYRHAVGHAVTEISSYQLEQSSGFHPEIAVWLNLADDHLERHGNIQGYLSAKAKIFSEQSVERDWSIVNIDDPYAEDVIAKAKGRLLLFGVDSQDASTANSARYSRDLSGLELRIDGQREFYNLRNSKLIGAHNASNMSAAVAAARLAGASKDAIQEVIENFMPLSHRLEIMRDRRGVIFVNDSKGTNVSSVVVALEAVRTKFPESRVLLLLGGETKRASWAPLVERISPSVTALMGFGADGGKVLAQISDEMKQQSAAFGGVAEQFADLESAVHASEKLAQAGDVVLLSPGGASFDAYNNYAERGEHFKSLVDQSS